MKFYLFLLLNLVIITAGMAQAYGTEELSNDENRAKKIAWLEERLDLSAEQVTTLEKQWPQDRDWVAKLELIESVLSPEQQDTFNEMQPCKRRGQKRGARKSGGKHHKSGPHLRPHFSDRPDSETKTKLIELRTKLEKQISIDDKIVLQEMRAIRRQTKSQKRFSTDEWNIMTDEERQVYKKRWKENVKAWKGKKEALHSLSEKYEPEIKTLFEENKSFFDEKWQKIQERKKAYQEEMRKRPIPPPAKRQHCQVMGNRLDMFSKGHCESFPQRKEAFLLLEADVPVELLPIEERKETNSLSIYPNPASTKTNVNYTINTAGRITVELRDMEGRRVQYIDNQQLAPGEYSKILDTSQLTGSTYFVTLWDGQELISEKLVVLR